MSRKRKMNSKDFEQKSGKDLEKKKIQIMDILNDDLNESFKKSSCEELLPEFSEFPSCDPLISDSRNNIDCNNYFVSVDDLNNVNKSDLLFSDTCNYEYVSPDNDLLNSVPESSNFYNETITLYGDNEKEILFNDNINLLSSNNVDCFAHANLEIASMTDNLKSIVSNPNLQQDGISFNSVSFESSEVETQIQPNYKTASENLLDISEPCCESVTNTFPKAQSNHPVSEEKILLNDFLNFKDSNIKENNNNNNINNFNKYYNCYDSFVRGFVKENIENAQQSKNSKINILSRHKLILRPNKSGLIQIPLDRFKAMKNLPTVKLCVKKSQLGDFRNKVLQLVNSGNNSSKTGIINDVEQQIETPEKIQSATVIKLDTADKSVQTCIEDGSNSEIIKVTNSHIPAIRKHSGSACVGERGILERIKKPELFKKKLLFTFAGNVRKSFHTTSQENFQYDDEKINYYTGIPKYSYFMALLNCLNLPNNHTISPFQMLLLTLMKIRLNLDWVDLAYRFDKSVQVAKDAFGITTYILTRCLSRLLCWPMQEFNTDLGCLRPSRILYIYSIKLNTDNCVNQEIKRRIFVCLSFSGHPVHFVSKPVSEKHNSRLDILEFSGVMDNLVKKDMIVFDEDINYLTANEDRSSVLTVLRDDRSSFCCQPLSADIQESTCKIKTVVGQIKKYKILYEKIASDWVSISSDEYTLFNDIVKVVCGLVNLCNVLPFSNTTVQKIITERKSIQIVLT